MKIRTEQEEREARRQRNARYRSKARARTRRHEVFLPLQVSDALKAKSRETGKSVSALLAEALNATQEQTRSEFDALRDMMDA